jgi:hypothetical protein
MLAILRNNPLTLEPIKMAVNFVAIQTKGVGDVGRFLVRTLSEGLQDTFR